MHIAAAEAFRHNDDAAQFTSVEAFLAWMRERPELHFAEVRIAYQPNSSTSDRDHLRGNDGSVVTRMGVLIITSTSAYAALGLYTYWRYVADGGGLS